MRAEADRTTLACHKLSQTFLTLDQGKPSQVLAIEKQQVKDAVSQPVAVPPRDLRLQGSEIRNPVFVLDDDLAVDDEVNCVKSLDGVGNPSKLIRPVVAPTGEQRNAPRRRCAWVR
jgi:hypothetical protein